MEVLVNTIPPQRSLFPSGTSVFEITVPELNVRQYLSLPFDNFHRWFGGNALLDIETDLLVFCGVVYVTDQLISRSLFDDNWTRHLSIQIPVKNPDLWNDQAHALSDMLETLTGDSWQLYFSERNIPIYHHGHRNLQRRQLYAARTACLFSGGIDSLAGAIDFLETHNEPLVLVGHYDLGSSAPQQQDYLYNSIRDEYPFRVNLIQERVGRIHKIHNHPGLNGMVRNPDKTEKTYRSRSIVFLGLGIFVTSQLTINGNANLLIPENGLIALNPPLTDARVGSCSTKTVHPKFLNKFQMIVNNLGIRANIHNPLLGKTKGEVIAQTVNQQLLHGLVDKTVSCAHPTRRQGWIRKRTTHCGYCIPCLYRRASLHRVGLDDGEKYGIDVWKGELGLNEKISSDCRAVLSWLYSAYHGTRTAQWLVQRLNLDPNLRPIAQHVIENGLAEMRKIIDDTAIPSVKDWAGLDIF